MTLLVRIGRYHNPVWVAEAIRLYLSGLSCRQVANEIGGNYGAVRLEVARAGLSRRGKPPMTGAEYVERHAKLIALRRLRLTYEQIGAACGFSGRRAAYICKIARAKSPPGLVP